MNKTVDILAECIICQTSYGLSSADRRSIIVMVVLTAIALILCYTGVLWYAIRTRFIPDKNADMPLENIHTNQAYDENEMQDEDIEENVQNTINPPAIIEPVVFTVENEKERY
jgi:hypothetical protein